MFTIRHLAKQFGISRTTILYYEKAQLLTPATTGENGYRYYTETEAAKLELILAYRRFGLSIREIKSMLNHCDLGNKFDLLHNQITKIEQQITQLRSQQHAMIKLLQAPQMLLSKEMNKASWVNILIASGFSEQDMTAWHQDFEQRDPNGHVLFLQTLGIDQDEIDKIRQL